MRIIYRCLAKHTLDRNANEKRNLSEDMTKNEQLYNQSCDTSNGSTSLEEQKLTNCTNTDNHEDFAMDDVYKIDKSLTTDYRGHTSKEKSDKRRRRLLVSAIVLVALVLVVGVITYICIYVKRVNDRADSALTPKTGQGVGKISDCNNTSSAGKVENVTSTPGVCTTESCLVIASELQRTMNLSADPCENFHEYACGQWANVHPLPASLPKLDTMGLLNIRKMEYLKKVLEQESRTVSSSSSSSRPVTMGFKDKILTYYKSCVDLEGIDKKGGRPLLDFISGFGRWSPIKPWEDVTNVVSITDLLLKTHKYFSPSVYDDTIRSPLFKTIVKVNDQNSSEHMFEFNLPNFPLSDTNDFFDKKPRSKKIREKYELLKTNYAALLGPSPDAQSILRKMWSFELRLANLSMAESAQRNVYQAYNFTTIARFQRYVGRQIDYMRFIQGLFRKFGVKITPGMKIGVRSIDYFKNLNDLIRMTDQQIVKDYIIWVCVWKFGPYVSGPYREAHYNFQRTLMGVEERPKRWKSCIEDIEQTMDFGLTALYVKKALTARDKLVATEIVKNVTRQFKNNLVNVEWMDVSTKAAAFAKVDSIADNIGYPDFVKNASFLDRYYASVHIQPNKYFENVVSMYAEKRLRNIALLRKRVDRAAFELPPTLVEAYFDVNKNKMVFLAGILHAPFYADTRPMALNYGALGLVAGHEVTHAFDDYGGQYDGKGEKKNWWSESSLRQFRKRSSCIKHQYGNYSIYGVNVNGVNTLGENIADNGGIKVAYMAYKDWVRTHGKEKLLPGIPLTMDQLFFVSHGQVWCGVYRPEYVKMNINTDYHSPSKFRIIGPLSNLKQFADSFKCKSGTAMNPKKKCEVW